MRAPELVAVPTGDVSDVSLVSRSHESPDGVVQELPPDPDIWSSPLNEICTLDLKQNTGTSNDWRGKPPILQSGSIGAEIRFVFRFRNKRLLCLSKLNRH